MFASVMAAGPSLARGISSSGTHLVASPPAGCDAAMRRDGITPGPGAGGSQLAGQAHLLLDVIARTPLGTWTGAFGRSAEQILAVPAGSWAPVLFTGWSRAAMAQRDQEWMAALLNPARGRANPARGHGCGTLPDRWGTLSHSCRTGMVPGGAAG
jgi:hypothetical protein